MKKSFYILLAVLLIASFATASANDTVSVIVDGKKLDTPALLIDNTTYVPLRAVSESMGAEVAWDGETRSAIVNSADSEKALTDAIGEASKSVVAITGNAKNHFGLMAHGTGVVIKSGGIILTNAHVAEDMENLTVILHDGSNFPAKVQYIDTEADLAVVKINKLGLKPIVFGDASSVIPGKTVYAIGTPLSLSMRNTVTKGIVSAVNVSATDSYYPLLQTDAAINGGNSGGPLITTDGKLIGINSSKFVGLGIEGLAFSIPLDTINFVLSQFEKNGKVLRPDIGISFENSWEASVGLPTAKGITVVSSTNASVVKGDELISVNGVLVHSITDYNTALRDTAKDGSILLTIKRNGEKIDLAVPYTLK